jgi:hypothetical protein
MCFAVQWNGFMSNSAELKKHLKRYLYFFRRTAAAAVAYVGLLVFCVTLFVLIISGNTNLPKWNCIFNTLPFFILLVPTKLPAKGNIANALMFLCLAFAV